MDALDHETGDYGSGYDVAETSQRPGKVGHIMANALTLKSFVEGVECGSIQQSLISRINA